MLYTYIICWGILNACTVAVWHNIIEFLQYNVTTTQYKSIFLKYVIYLYILIFNFYFFLILITHAIPAPLCNLLVEPNLHTGLPTYSCFFSLQIISNIFSNNFELNYLKIYFTLTTVISGLQVANFLRRFEPCVLNSDAANLWIFMG